MIRIKVKFYGVIKDIIKEPAAEFEMPDGATMADLLDVMRRRYGDEFGQRVLDERIGVRTYVKLFLNDEEVDNEAVRSTRLSTAGDRAEATVYVMPSSTGGTPSSTGGMSSPTGGIPSSTGGAAPPALSP